MSDEFAGGFDVGDALVVGFALDAAVALVAELGQGGEERRPIDFAGADGDFRAALDLLTEMQTWVQLNLYAEREEVDALLARMDRDAS